MDDDEGDKEGGRNKGKPNGRNMANDFEMRRVEDKIDNMVKSKDVLMRETMQAKITISKNKLEEKKGQLRGKDTNSRRRRQWSSSWPKRTRP